MKIKNLIASAFFSLGLIGAASVANASTTVTLNSVTYNEVFITGSSAARANIFYCVDTNSGGVFDSLPTLIGYNGATPSSGTGSYIAYGNIGGQPYLLNFSFTGSEAGIYAMEHQSAGEPNPYDDTLYNGTNALGVLPGTPSPTTFINPNNDTQYLPATQADLAMADTSQAVSLTAPPAYTALKDYGCVGCVTFEWVKGPNSSPDQSWIDLTNVTDWQMNNNLSGPQVASYFTGNSNDLDTVYMIGRNIGSGTHVNTMLVTQHGVRGHVDQFAPANCGYTNGTLSIGNTSVTLAAAGGLVDIGNDGFDSGGGVAGVLEMNENGTHDAYGQIICVGYVGVSDAATPITDGAAKMSDDGVLESDGAVINGDYPFWGHEHLYGAVGEDANPAVVAVGHAIAGADTTASIGQGVSTADGALERAGRLGGDEPMANWLTSQSSIIDPKVMLCDKPTDAGYPGQIQ